MTNLQQVHTILSKALNQLSIFMGDDYTVHIICQHKDEPRAHLLTSPVKDALDSLVEVVSDLTNIEDQLIVTKEGQENVN